MTHEQLVEQIAQAIHDTDDMADTTWPTSQNDDGYRGGNGHVRVCRWPEVYREAARAALSVVYEAMREPTIEMIAAFWRQKNTGTQETGEIGPDFDDLSCARALLAASPLNPEGGR